MENVIRREQHFAVSKAGILSHINYAHNNSEEYYCPHCGCRMIKRCGKIRAWHFAHDWRYANETQRTCSYETYLHGYAKLRLKQWFDESESIILHYNQSIACKRYNSCNLRNDNCRCVSYESCDIKQIFNHCTIEAPVKESNGIYRADLLLSSDNNPSRHILLEIKVSHGCTEKKKASNAKIIEFDITSEDDVEYIITHDIEATNKVKYYGFKNIVKTDDRHLIRPAFSFQKFTLYRSGKTHCKTMDCQSILERHGSAIFELTAKVPIANLWQLNKYGLLMAQKQGFKFPNCYFCQHYVYKSEIIGYGCNIKNAAIETGADALQCKSYAFKAISFERINRTFPIEPLDVWSVSPQKTSDKTVQNN